VELAKSGKIENTGPPAGACGPSSTVGGTLAFVDQVVKLCAFARAQPHNVLLDGNFFCGHESPPALAYRHRGSENPVSFNDAGQ
jgi:hypothetical protein